MKSKEILKLSDYKYMKEKTKYGIKREERERDREDQGKRMRVARTKKSLGRYGILFVALVFVGYGIILLARSAGPQGEDFSMAYPLQGRDHIAFGSTHPEYNSNPPSSGPHYEQPARGGFYNEVVDDETVVHNLEHGDIWIAYHPRVSNEVKSNLEKFAGRYVVVSPRSANKDDIALVAWGRVDTFTIESGVLDEGRIKNFIRRYDNRGPEKVRQLQVGHGGF